MKPTFYPRLAWMGIKKNARLYVPYLLSCAFMAAMLYVIAYLAVTPALYTVCLLYTSPSPRDTR